MASIQEAQELIRANTSLETLKDALYWRRQADAMATTLIHQASAIEEEAKILLEEAVTLRKEARAKSILGWIWKSPIERSKRLVASQKIGESQRLREMVRVVFRLIEDTPSTKEEKSEMLQSLKLQKKEMQLEKRQEASAIRAVRTDARHRSASAGVSIFGSKYTANSRKLIRFEKERAIKGMENKQVSIDEVIMSIDREILRIEKFR